MALYIPARPVKGMAKTTFSRVRCPHLGPKSLWKYKVEVMLSCTKKLLSWIVSLDSFLDSFPAGTWGSVVFTMPMIQSYLLFPWHSACSIYYIVSHYASWQLPTTSNRTRSTYCLYAKRQASLSVQACMHQKSSISHTDAERSFFRELVLRFSKHLL